MICISVRYKANETSHCFQRAYISNLKQMIIWTPIIIIIIIILAPFIYCFLHIKHWILLFDLVLIPILGNMYHCLTLQMSKLKFGKVKQFTQPRTARIWTLNLVWLQTSVFLTYHMSNSVSITTCYISKKKTWNTATVKALRQRSVKRNLEELSKCRNDATEKPACCHEVSRNRAEALWTGTGI